MFLHDYRTHERGLADELNYDTLVAEDILQLKEHGPITNLGAASTIVVEVATSLKVRIEVDKKHFGK